MPLGYCIWKYLRRHSGQEGPKVALSVRGQLCHLPMNSHNGTSISEAAPSMDKCACERVFQNAYAIDKYAFLIGMIFDFHFNSKTS